MASAFQRNPSSTARREIATLIAYSKHCKLSLVSSDARTTKKHSSLNHGHEHSAYLCTRNTRSISAHLHCGGPGEVDTDAGPCNLSQHQNYCRPPASDQTRTLHVSGSYFASSRPRNNEPVQCCDSAQIPMPDRLDRPNMPACPHLLQTGFLMLTTSRPFR